MLEQVLDSVVILGRNFVDVPGYPAPVDVWTFHDFAFVLLWSSYTLIVLWEVTPWKPGRLTIGRVLIVLFGFSLMTAGLWIAQDTMNAKLVLDRSFVDLPFFLMKLDAYQARDLAVLLSASSYVSFYLLARVVRES